MNAKKASSKTTVHTLQPVAGHIEGPVKVKRKRTGKKSVGGMSANQREKLMGNVDKRRGVIRSQVQAVVHGYTNALFVYGPGGLGKSHAITSELDVLLGKSWVHHTAYSTPKALMMSLMEAPSAIHLFEDCEKMYKTDVSASILRSACGAPRGRERWVTYETAHEKIRLNFTGGIVIVSNENLSKTKGPLTAVASRFRPIKWDLTRDERIACILDIADRGWERDGRKLTAAECRQVAKFLVDQMQAGEIDFAVDLRTFVEHALPAFAQWKDSQSESHWHEVVKAKLSGDVGHVERRDERVDRLQMLAVNIAQRSDLDGKKKVALWKEQTGLGQAIFYRHLAKAKASKGG